MDKSDFDRLEKRLKEVRVAFKKALAEWEKEFGPAPRTPNLLKPENNLELRKKRMNVLKRDFPDAARVLEEWEAKYRVSVLIHPPTPTAPVAKASKFLQDFMDD